MVKHVGPTAASKILHPFNPELFVMWDGEIRKRYGVGGSAEDYEVPKADEER